MCHQDLASYLKNIGSECALNELLFKNDADKTDDKTKGLTEF